MPFTPAAPGLVHPPAANQAMTGLNPANVGSTGGQIATQKTVSTLYDYSPFAIWRNVIERHERIPDFRIMLAALGFSEGAEAPTIGHYERDWHNNTIKFGSIVTASTGPGTNVVVALDASVMFNASATVNGVAQSSSDVREGDLILLANGSMARVHLKDTSFTPHRLTLRPLQTTQDLATTVVAGTDYFVATNAFAEGTGLPTGRIPRLYKYTNTFQIVKEGFGATGSEASNRLFVNFTGGADGDTILGVLSSDAVRDFERKAGNALLFSNTSNNVTIFNPNVGFDVPVNTTEGLLPWAVGNGHQSIITIATYSLDDFYAAARIHSSEGTGTSEYLCLDGFDMYVATEKLLLNQIGDDLTPLYLNQKFGAPSVAGEGMQPFNAGDFSFSAGFRAARVAGDTYLFKRLHQFSSFTEGGNPTYNYNSWRVIMPLGMTKDRKTNKPTFMIGYRYKATGGYSREVQVGEYGGIGTNGIPVVRPLGPVNDIDMVRAGMLTEIGFHGTTPNNVIVQKPA